MQALPDEIRASGYACLNGSLSREADVRLHVCGKRVKQTGDRELN